MTKSPEPEQDTKFKKVVRTFLKTPPKPHKKRGTTDAAPRSDLAEEDSKCRQNEKGD